MQEMMAFPLPDVPVCRRLYRDEEGLKQPVDRQLQPYYYLLLLLLLFYFFWIIIKLR